MRFIAPVVTMMLVSGSASAQLITRINGMTGQHHGASDVVALANGDLAIAGGAYEFSGGFESFATLTRVGPDGVPVWHRRIDEAGKNEYAFGVRELSNGNMILGFFRGFGIDALCFAGVSATGAVTWTTRLPGEYAYDGAGIKLDTDTGGTFAVVASQWSNLNPIAGQLVRVNAQTGTLDFNRFYSPTLFDSASDLWFTDVAVVEGGDYFVTGTVLRDVGTQSDYDVLVARIRRSDGSVVWAQAYGLTNQFSDENPFYEIGRGINLNSAGQVVVAARTQDPTQEFGPESVLHLLIDPSNGNLLTHTIDIDCQVADASVERLSSGEMLVSGSRGFGDGQGFARMWLLDPATMTIIRRAEYLDGTSFGTDAVEHVAPDQGLVLTGTHFTTNNIGFPDQMFIRTDLLLNDGCTADVVTPERLEPPITVTRVGMIKAEATPVFVYEPPNLPETMSTALVCVAVPCVGDLNNDNQVDDADFVIFAAAYNILDCLDPLMPPGCPADLNGDGFVDDSDFVIFANAYNQLLCP
jgi:hypothetical protein